MFQRNRKVARIGPSYPMRQLEVRQGDFVK